MKKMSWAFSLATVGSMAMGANAFGDAPLPNIHKQPEPQLRELHNCSVTRLTSNEPVYVSRVLVVNGTERLVVTMEMQGERPRAVVAPEGVTAEQAKFVANSTCAQVANKIQAAAGMPYTVRKPVMI